MMGIVERKKKERRKEMNVLYVKESQSITKELIIVNVLSHLTSNWAMAVFVWMENSVNYNKETISEQINIIITVQSTCSIIIKR